MRIAPNKAGETIKRNDRNNPAMVKAMACMPDNTNYPPPPKRKNLARGDPQPKNRTPVVLTPAKEKPWSLFGAVSRTEAHSDYRQREAQAGQGEWQHYTAADWDHWNNSGSSSNTRSSGETRSRTPREYKRR